MRKTVPLPIISVIPKQYLSSAIFAIASEIPKQRSMTMRIPICEPYTQGGRSQPRSRTKLNPEG